VSADSTSGTTVACFKPQDRGTNHESNEPFPGFLRIAMRSTAFSVRAFARKELMSFTL
jgi:hypothetical protein